MHVGAIAVLMAACELGFADRGFTFVADNRSDVGVLAAVTRRVSIGQTTERRRQVLAVPPGGKVVLGEQPFAGNRVTRIEILTEACTVVADFFDFSAGAVVFIDDGPTATLVREWPEAPRDPLAEPVEACAGPAPSVDP